MIINAGTILLTLVVIFAASYIGLKLIRKFALQIAKENHDAVLAMDQQEETMRLKKQQRNADAAAESAFAKVRPIVTTTNVAPTTNRSAANTPTPPTKATSPSNPSTPPPDIMASASV